MAATIITPFFGDSQAFRGRSRLGSHEPRQTARCRKRRRPGAIFSVQRSSPKRPKRKGLGAPPIPGAASPAAASARWSSPYSWCSSWPASRSHDVVVYRESQHGIALMSEGAQTRTPPR